MDWGGGGVDVTVSGMDKVLAYSSGGTDSATLVGTTGNDTLQAYVDSRVLKGTGYSNSVYDFANVTVDITTNPGGFDQAKLYDSSGSDQFVGTPTGATMDWGSDTVIDLNVSGYDRVTAYLDNGGTDSATLVGSFGSDKFEAREGYRMLKGPGFDNRAYGFANVTDDITTNAGGIDKAYLYDSPGSDAFVGTPTGETMDWGSDTVIDVSVAGYKHVYAYSDNGGTDSATLVGSSGNDKYYGLEEYLSLEGLGFKNVVYGFASVTDDITTNPGGFDQAYFYDSSGSDQFVGTSPARPWTGEATA